MSQDEVVLQLTRLYPAREASNIVRWLFAHVREQMGGQPPALQQVHLAGLVGRLLQNEPLAYVLGYWEFYGLKMRLTPDVLIPRPETEELVLQALRYLRRKAPVGGATFSVLDAGTGSGCIAVALARHLPLYWQVHAMDCSEPALAVASLNAGAHGVSVSFVCADMLSPEYWLTLAPRPLHALVSNPPYVAFDEQHLMSRHTLQHEPHGALFAPAQQPLAFYQAIAQWSPRCLAPQSPIWLEINEFRATETRQIFCEYPYWQQVEVLHDLSGRPRILHAIYRP